MPEEIAELDRRISQLRKYVMALALLWVGTTGLWFMKTSPFVVRAAQPESLTVKRLAVVDQKGTERVVISAPLPELMINGKREKRDSPVSGMLIFDPKGNERGGYVTSDGADLAALLTLDSENDQVFTAYANADSGATVWVTNEKHQNVVMSTHNTSRLIESEACSSATATVRWSLVSQLLKSSDCTQNPLVGSISDIPIFQQLVQARTKGSS